jgi:hypothetical protein
MTRTKAYSPTCLEMEVCVARKFNIRQCIIVPNISWGLQIHECDLLIVSKSGYATEVEIKISLADLKKDANKKHAHTSQKIKYLYFAIPEKLLPYIEYIPAHAGIFVLKRGKYNYGKYSDSPLEYSYVEKVREPQKNPHSRALFPNEITDVMRLGCMRIWRLKQTVLEHAKNKKNGN